MAKQVFIVTQGYYSDYRIEAVFTSEEKAKEYIRVAAHNNQMWDSSAGYSHDYNIEVYELDKELPKMLEYVVYHATFINGVLENRFNVYARESPRLTTYKSYYFNVAGAPRGTRLAHRLDIEGAVKLRQNETSAEVCERARKIATDEYYRWKQMEEEK